MFLRHFNSLIISSPRMSRYTNAAIEPCLVSTSFGGTKGSITLAGQSSGATLIRGLLAAPSASSYFKNAWLHSDPLVSSNDRSRHSS